MLAKVQVITVVKKYRDGASDVVTAALVSQNKLCQRLDVVADNAEAKDTPMSGTTNVEMFSTM